MNKFIGKVALVTGASSGIGAKIAEDLAYAGMKVVGLARRLEKVEELAVKVAKSSMNLKAGKLYPYKIDVTNEDEILKAFQWTKNNLGPIHVLINNAGIHRYDSLSDGETAAWKATFDTNIMSLCICTREAVRDMKANGVDGHIVHINSVTGHRIPAAMTGVYAASKFAVTALAETLRLELVAAGSNVKVTSISPGVVESEMTNKIIDNFKLKYLNTEDISNSVLHVLGTPPHVQIHELTILPVGEKL